MIKSNHTLSYCPQCETEIVKCATCNNNCCNGGFGTVNGETCTDCDDAYAIQTIYWEDNSSVEFAKTEDLEALKKIDMDEVWKKFFADSKKKNMSS